MATDRARNSYDATRQYRSVVAQQGRATVEADSNEAEQIRAVELRADLVDIIGPSGTPDAGYSISVPPGAGFDFGIAAGTIYVGGLRVHLPTAQTYASQKQTEWFDCPVDDVDVPESAVTEVVYLELAEQEVTAVEDRALLEDALGGPDTAGRTRLIQRVRRKATTRDDCESALVEVLHERFPGLTLDAATAELQSSARLQVTPIPVPEEDNKCQPIAKAGFLGAENQLIRLQVSALPAKLLWGYDNASALYRAKTPAVGSFELELLGHPVDEFHRPRARQWVEVLHAAVDLGDDEYIAGAVGEAYEVAGYDGGSNKVTLATAITDTSDVVFVRVWESQVSFAGTTDLRDAGGVSIGLRITSSGTGTPGDHWMVGVRPTQPEKLYPARLAQPTPPDGPKRWAIPLARIVWSADGNSGVVHDCRKPFKPLTEDDDLEFHNQHLHGWGVVCGLQVRCMTAEIAERLRLERERRREWVNVWNGYAIDPTGADIRLRSGTNFKFTPLDLGTLAAPILGRENGQLGDGTVSLWIDKQRAFHVEKFEPKPQGLERLLDGTILRDIYDDCIAKVIELVRGEITPGVNEPLVGPAAKRLIAVINLLFQLSNQTDGRHIYLSGEPTAQARDTEDAILRTLFEKLKKLLESKTLCGVFDDATYPERYNVYRDLPSGRHPTTIFGTGRHTRLRVRPKPDNNQPLLAFTCGTTETIHAYDLEKQTFLAATPFPGTGAKVQDVAFSTSGTEIYAIAWIGGSDAETVLAAGTIRNDGTIAWLSQAKHPFSLVTLATSRTSPDELFAAARGTGVLRFDQLAIAQPPDVLQRFPASGHLTATHDTRQTFLYAGDNTDSGHPTEFDRIRAIEMSNPGQTFFHNVPALQGNGLGFGHDDIAVAFSNMHGVNELYAIVDGETADTRRLLVWEQRETGNPTKIIPLDESAGNRITYNATGNWSLLSYEAQFLGRTYLPGGDALVDAPEATHPLQIAPTAIASEGDHFYVLEWFSNTITMIPAVTGGEPGRSAIDIPLLENYRLEAIRAYTKLLARFLQYVKDCACDKLLVDCPDPRGKKVYLADIEFRDGGVYKICNFHHRKYVHTFPTVEYWMSLVPIIPLIKQAVEKVCCSVLSGLLDSYLPTANRDDKRDGMGTMAWRKTLLYGKFKGLQAEAALRKPMFDELTTLAKTMFTDTLPAHTKPPTPAPVEVTVLTATHSDAATKLAKSRGIAVRKTVVASDPIATAFRTTISRTAFAPGTAVDLITDAKGIVIGAVEAVPEEAPPETPLETIEPEVAVTPGRRRTPTASEVTTLRRELKTMQDVHKKQLTEMESQVKALREAMEELRNR